MLVRARVLCAGHALVVSSYGSAARGMRTLCHRSSRACSSCSVARKACSCVLVVLLVVTAVCGQRADAPSSFVARSHALAYLWCWYSSMVFILAPPALSPEGMLLSTYFCGVCWYNSMMVSINRLVQSSYG